MKPFDIDLYDLDRFARDGVPHEMFAALRRESPLFRHPEPDGRGFWALTKYEDVRAASRDPRTFSSFEGGTNIWDPPPEHLAVIQTMMLNMDPPQHSKYRRLVSQGFIPRMVEQLKLRVHALATEIVDQVAARGECDFVTEVAAELPLQVIAEMLGIPLSDRHQIFDWSNRLIGFDDPEYQSSMDDGQAAAAELWAYAHELARERKQNPKDDLVSVLMHANVDGEMLTEAEFDSFFLLLTVAGNETTRNLISGGMLALIEHPEQRQRLLSQPSLLATAIEEMVRWVTPVIHFRRTLTRDVEIRGHALTAGEKVVLFYSSANRDEEIFERADQFDVGRMPNEHLGFGFGEHFCLGANLARLEIRIMFEELLRRLPDMELTAPVVRLRSNFINGIKHMPVRFTPERARKSVAA